MLLGAYHPLLISLFTLLNVLWAPVPRRAARLAPDPSPRSCNGAAYKPRIGQPRSVTRRVHRRAPFHDRPPSRNMIRRRRSRVPMALAQLLCGDTAGRAPSPPASSCRCVLAQDGRLRLRASSNPDIRLPQPSLSPLSIYTSQIASNLTLRGKAAVPSSLDYYCYPSTLHLANQNNAEKKNAQGPPPPLPIQ